MTPREVAALLAYVARLDPRAANLAEAEAADRLRQWCELLSDVPATSTAGRGWDAARIARDHIAQSPYPILPADISRRWHAHKRDAIGRHTDPTPAVDPDDVRAYQAALAAGRQAVATGQAAPTTLRELTGGAHPDVQARLDRLGRYVPATVGQQLAKYRPTRAAREHLARTSQTDPLDVPCDWCHAPAGRQCSARSVRANGALASRRRNSPHPSRIDAAELATHSTPESAR